MHYEVDRILEAMNEAQQHTGDYEAGPQYLRQSEWSYAGRFLDACQAKPSSVELYARWLATWLNQGGKIHRYHQDLKLSDSVWAMVTRGANMEIPAGYNNLVLKLILAECVDATIPNIPMTINGQSLGDELGHPTVLRLDMCTEQGLVAWTNRPEVVESYEDVDEYIRCNLTAKRFLVAVK